MTWIMICADPKSTRSRTGCGFEQRVQQRDWHACPRCGGTMITKQKEDEPTNDHN